MVSIVGAHFATSISMPIRKTSVIQKQPKCIGREATLKIQCPENQYFLRKVRRRRVSKGLRPKEYASNLESIFFGVSSLLNA
jgi:hypothetical protein